MSTKYFRYFPKTPHDLTNIGQTVNLTNILRRFKIESELKNNTQVFTEYDIQAGDRPDTIAAKYYGDSGYAWVILMFNEIHDPVFGWPLFNRDFDNYIIGKYGSVDAANAVTDHYLKILSDKIVNNDGTIIPERTVRIDLTTYNSLGASEKRAPTCYEAELDLNEAKRKIKILHKKYIPQVRDEVRSILRHG